MYGCESWTKEGWTPKNWCFQIIVLEKTLESPLDCKEIKPVNPKANQSWIFIGRTDAESPILQPPDMKSQLNGKDLDARKDQREQGKELERMRWLDSITDSMDTNVSNLRETVEDRGAWCAVIHGVGSQSQTGPDNWSSSVTQWVLKRCLLDEWISETNPFYLFDSNGKAVSH